MQNGYSRIIYKLKTKLHHFKFVDLPTFSVLNSVYSIYYIVVLYRRSQN